MATLAMLGGLGGTIGTFATAPSRAEAAESTFTAVADSYVESSSPTKNFGTRTTARVDSSPTRVTYLRFDVQNAGSVSSALLEVYVENTSTVGILAREVADTTWSETGIVYDNAPTMGPVLGATDAISSTGWRTIDVSGAITGNGLYSFGLTTGSSTAISMRTRESSSAPRLIINPDNPSPYTVTRSGSTYTATSATGPTYSGTLKSVVQSAVETVDPFPGSMILFQAGTYDLGGDWFEFQLVTDVAFVGAGMSATTITNNTGAATDTEPFDMTNSDKIVIRDLTVSAGGPFRTTSDAIDFDGGDDVLIENVAVTSARGRGIVFDGKDLVNDGHSSGNIVRNCHVSGVPSHGIELLAANGNRIEGCTISLVAGNGIYLNKSSSSASIPHKPSDDNQIVGNTVDGSGRDGIALNAGSRNLLQNNSVRNSSRITDNRDGIRLNTDGSAACEANRLEGNELSDTQVMPTQRYGIAITSASCVANIIGVNTFSGNQLGTILDQGTNTIYEGQQDTEPPSVPTGLQLIDVTNTSATIGWSPSTDNVGVVSYEIFRDAVSVGSEGTTSFTDTGLTAATPYAYTVRALDAAGNASAQSSPLSVTTSNGGATVVTLSPVADSHVDADLPTTNFGGATTFKADASPIRRSYLRFNVPANGTVTSARLRIYAASASSVGHQVSPLFNLSDTNTWTETGLTFNNSPAPGAAVASSGPFSSGSYIEVDVTQIVTAGALVSMVVSTTSNTQISYQSREGTNHPQLVVNFG